jgi:hypothetical protein
MKKLAQLVLATGLLTTAWRCLSTEPDRHNPARPI